MTTPTLPAPAGQTYEQLQDMCRAMSLTLSAAADREQRLVEEVRQAKIEARRARAASGDPDVETLRGELHDLRYMLGRFIRDEYSNEATIVQAMRESTLADAESLEARLNGKYGRL